MNGRMFHVAPWPSELEDLVDHVAAFEGWSFRLAEEEHDGDCTGLRLHITVRGDDAYHPDKRLGVIHAFIVPAATYDRANWQRWLYDRCADVQRHELGEHFAVDGVRPYAPNHGPGNDPCFPREVFEASTDEQRRTNDQGIVKPGPTDSRPCGSKNPSVLLPLCFCHLPAGHHGFHECSAGCHWPYSPDGH